MTKTLVGIPSFRDWANTINRVAQSSGGRVMTHPIDDLDEVLSLAKRFRVQAIIPATYPQMKVLEHQRHAFAAFGCKLVCCDDFELVQTFDDKVRFIRYMDDYGLMDLVPEVYVVQHDGQRIDYGEIRYPCIFKHAVTFGGTGSSVHLDPSRPPDLDGVPSDTAYIVQEFIPGNVEYGGHLYLENGAVVRSLYYRGTRDASIQIQRGHMARYDRLETIDEAADIENIFASVPFTGFACVDFKVVDGRPKVFEINPRMGGTLIHNQSDLLSFFDTAGA